MGGVAPEPNAGGVAPPPDLNAGSVLPAPRLNGGVNPGSVPLAFVVVAGCDAPNAKVGMLLLLLAAGWDPPKLNEGMEADWVLPKAGS